MAESFHVLLCFDFDKLEKRVICRVLVRQVYVSIQARGRSVRAHLTTSKHEVLPDEDW